jgi:CheY-like chemotaxis protein
MLTLTLRTWAPRGAADHQCRPSKTAPIEGRPPSTPARVRASPDTPLRGSCEHGPVRPTVLIVDDHAGFRGFARAMLDAEGFEVIGEAGDGETAVRAVHLLVPDLVLLDVALPDIDGFEVCERVSSLDGTGPQVVLTSSRDASTFGSRLAASAALGFIPKADLTGPALSAVIRGSG